MGECCGPVFKSFRELIAKKLSRGYVACMSDPEILQKIKNILRAEDPIGLIKMGAPSDEYDTEALIIYEHVNAYFPLSKIQSTVHNIFVHYFSGEKIAGKYEHYESIAKQIKELIGDK
jgi:hypothetical protein